jgi:transposase
MRPRGSAKELERRRFRAVELIEQGEPRELVSRILGVSRGALSRWCRKAPLGTLEAKQHMGHPCRLTDQDCELLKDLLGQGATAHGWLNNFWTARRVAQIIRTHFGVEYHPAHVGRILRKRLNWTCQRPEHHHMDRNDAAIQKWMRKTFPRIVRDAMARKAHLVFIDEAGFMLEPTIRRTYAPRGKTPVHRIANPHGRISAIGAITIRSSRDAIDLVYGLLGDNLNFRGPTIVQFLRTLRSQIAGPMTIIWDRIPIHECEDLNDYLAETREVVLEPFPPHAPELNPADGIWRYIKFGRLANYCPKDLGVLRETLTKELNRLKRRAKLLKSFVRFTELPIEL